MLASDLEPHAQLPVLACKEKLCLAAKQRIRRMVAEKRRRTDLAVPDWVRAEWERGTEAKDRMAQCLQDANWCKVRVDNKRFSQNKYVFKILE